MVSGSYTRPTTVRPAAHLLIHRELLRENLVMLRANGHQEALLVQVAPAVAPGLDQVVNLRR